MKEKLLALWNKVWTKVKSWAKETALPWLTKGWMHIVNILIVLYAYAKLDDAIEFSKLNESGALVDFSAGPAVLVGLWAFILLVFYVFWKFFGLDKVVKSMWKNRKKK